MPQQSPFSGELSIQEKILLARGGSPDSAGARLEVLVALSGDANEEVRRQSALREIFVSGLSPWLRLLSRGTQISPFVGIENSPALMVMQFVPRVGSVRP